LVENNYLIGEKGVKMEDEIKCKYCDEDGAVKFGTYKGVQRYWCKICKRKFKADDTTFHMKTDTNLVSSALNMYYEGMPIRAIRRHLLQEHAQAPSTATIYEWIQKYTQYATDSIKEYHPNVGDIWIADETVLKIDGQQLWLWDIIDDKTRYLLATRLSRSRTTQDAQTLIDRAKKTAGKTPKLVITDKLPSYLDVAYGKDVEHRQGGIARKEDNTQKIERFHGTLKQRTKVMRGLKNFETALDFADGWLVHYNYLRPHESLQDKTPAQASGITYPYLNWADIIRKYVPVKKIIIEHMLRTAPRLLQTRIGRIPDHIRLSQKAPSISHKPAKLSNSIYVSKSGVMSRHPFRGGRRRRIR
jgi:transposase-like protein